MQYNDWDSVVVLCKKWNFGRQIAPHLLVWLVVYWIVKLGMQQITVYGDVSTWGRSVLKVVPFATGFQPMCSLRTKLMFLVANQMGGSRPVLGRTWEIFF